MKTLHLIVDIEDLAGAKSEEAIQRAAEILKSGGTVAFPTETVYGLGANALDETAVARIFEAKQRPRWDPLIVHIAEPRMLAQIASGIPECAMKLMRAFWPGPLTLLLPKAPRVPAIVTAGRPRIGVRMPAHPVAGELIRRAGVPIAAPSANTFGRISPTSAAHVLQDLDGRIDAVLDAGETQHGLESTVVDTCESPVTIYRPGVVTLAQIAAVCGEALNFVAPDATHQGKEQQTLPSPGMGIRHYAPCARLVLIEGDGEAQRAAFAQAADDARKGGERVGLMLPKEFEPHLAVRAEKVPAFRWGRWGNQEELAQRLFAGLRQLDATGATVILCPMPSATGIGIAMRDRLQKAAMKA